MCKKARTIVLFKLPVIDFAVVSVPDAAVHMHQVLSLYIQTLSRRNVSSAF